MFERFTDQARQVVVLAREEAGLLDHDYIGTEHLLLGLIAQGRGPAAQVLSSLGIALDSMRGEVGTAAGRSQPPAGPSGHVRLTPFGHIPFTPRAKKVLELSLREALRYGHDFVGTEHILLSILSEGGGLAVPLLEKRGADAAQIRQRIQQHFADDPDAAAGEVTPGSGHVPGPRRGHLPRPLRVAWDEVLPLVEAIEARLTAIEEHLGITAEAPDAAGESPRTAADDASEQEPP